eukprot:3845440-Amphidinium_carterae.1
MLTGSLHRCSTDEGKRRMCSQMQTLDSFHHTLFGIVVVCLYGAHLHVAALLAMTQMPICACTHIERGEKLKQCHQSVQDMLPCTLKEQIEWSFGPCSSAPMAAAIPKLPPQDDILAEFEDLTGIPEFCERVPGLSCTTINVPSTQSKEGWHNFLHLLNIADGIVVLRPTCTPDFDVDSQELTQPRHISPNESLPF